MNNYENAILRLFFYIIVIPGSLLFTTANKKKQNGITPGKVHTVSPILMIGLKASFSKLNVPILLVLQCCKFHLRKIQFDHDTVIFQI